MTSSLYFGYDPKNIINTNNRDKIINETLNIISNENNKNQEPLLAQVLGNNRPLYSQSEYTNQFNLSSSVYFQNIHQRFQEKNHIDNNEAVIKEYEDDLREIELGETNNKENLKNSYGPYISYIKGGEDVIPGKSFTASQSYFRDNIVGRSKLKIKK